MACIQVSITVITVARVRSCCCRYNAEFRVAGPLRDAAVAGASAGFEAAMRKAEGLAPTHPIRLGVVLNLSVFLHEIAQKPAEAMDTAKQARVILQLPCPRISCRLSTTPIDAQPM